MKTLITDVKAVEHSAWLNIFVHRQEARGQQQQQQQQEFRQQNIK